MYGGISLRTELSHFFVPSLFKTKETIHVRILSPRRRTPGPMKPKIEFQPVQEVSVTA
jgi:hypothetical protein